MRDPGRGPRRLAVTFLPRRPGWRRARGAISSARLKPTPIRAPRHERREVEPGEQGANGRDLVALVLYRLLSEDDSGAVLSSGDEQVLGARIVPGGTTDGVPVDGDGVGARGLLCGPGARRAVEHVGVQVGENLDERGRGRGGEAPQTGAVERPQARS